MRALIPRLKISGRRPMSLGVLKVIGVLLILCVYSAFSAAFLILWVSADACSDPDALVLHGVDQGVEVGLGKSVAEVRRVADIFCLTL